MQAKVEADAQIAMGWWDSLLAKLFAYIIPGIQIVMHVIVSMIDTLLIPLVELNTAMQGNRTPGFYSMVAGVIGDLLGMEVDPSSIQAGFQQRGEVGAMKAIGAKLYDALAGEFSRGDVLTPQQGVAAAQSFLGFLMSFAIREGNMALIWSLIPEDIRYGEGIREYGEMMAKNLGLGRMARRALQPLIQTVIADPLQWALNQQYHPKMLGPDVATRAYNRQLINNADWFQEMSYAGYNPARSVALQSEYLSHIPTSDIEVLRNLGKFTDDDAVRALWNQNYDNGSAQQIMQVWDANAAKPYVDALATTLRTLHVNGDIDRVTFEAAVDRLNIGAAAQAAIKDNVATELLYPRKQLTLAEIQSAYVSGLVDLDQLGAYLQKSGYSSDDATVLTMQTLLKLDTKEAQIRVAQFKYDKAVKAAQAKNEPIPPPPAILATGAV